MLTARLDLARTQLLEVERLAVLLLASHPARRRLLARLELQGDDEDVLAAQKLGDLTRSVMQIRQRMHLQTLLEIAVAEPLPDSDD